MLCSARSLILISLTTVLSCVSNNGPSSWSSGCDSCGGNDWPNLIIGIPPDANIVQVWLPELKVEATRGGCPAEFDTTRRLCSWSFSIPGADGVRVAAQTEGGEELTATLKVYPNDCARNIAYLEVSKSDGALGWGKLTYIDPCSSSAL